MATVKKSTTKPTKTPMDTSTPNADVEALKKTIINLNKEVNMLKKEVAEMKLSSGTMDSTLRNVIVSWSETLPSPVLTKFLKRNGINKKI